jgi:hypothetical protein
VQFPPDTPLTWKLASCRSGAGDAQRSVALRFTHAAFNIRGGTI